jgi:hypothetical protein
MTMSSLSFRKLDREIGETTPTGDATRTETVYEYGAEIDGVFVRLGTIGAGQVDDARNRAQAEQERNPQPDQPDASRPSGAKR